MRARGPEGSTSKLYWSQLDQEGHPTSLVTFSNTGGNTSVSTVTVSNSVTPTPGMFLAGFPVSVPTGATLTAGTTPIVGLTTSGTITIKPSGSLLAVGPGSTLKVGK